MLVFSVLEEDIKIIMNKLLQADMFNDLEVRNIFIETIVKYDISGNINKEYLNNNNNVCDVCDTEERYFIKWSEIKKVIFNIIKGSRKPKNMKIVFSLDDKSINSLCDSAGAMFLNMNYNNEKNINELIFTTGVSQKVFSLEKKEEKIWEDYVIKFFEQNNINIKVIE